MYDAIRDVIRSDNTPNSRQVVRVLVKVRPELRAVGYEADEVVDTVVAMLLCDCRDYGLDEYDLARHCEGGPDADVDPHTWGDPTPMAVWIRRLIMEQGEVGAARLIRQIGR